jgi:hypothetical protein
MRRGGRIKNDKFSNKKLKMQYSNREGTPGKIFLQA